MRWYDANSEQLAAIEDALLAYRARLVESIDAACKAGLPRAYAQERQRMAVAEQAIESLIEVRKTDRSD